MKYFHKSYTAILTFEFIQMRLLCSISVIELSFLLSQSVITFSYMWFLYVFSILKKKLFNLVIWKACKQVGEVFLPCHSLVCSYVLTYCTTPHHQQPWKNNSNKRDMIIFLITEPGNSTEICGIRRKMPRASPVRSAVFILFFSPEFCLWLFWLAEAYPHNLTKPQQIPNATTTLCS